MIPFFLDTILKLQLNPSFLAITSMLMAFISGIIVPFVVLALQKRRGKIAYMHIVVGNVLQTHHMYGPGPFHTIKWKIWNWGNKTIEPGDYRNAPIKFTFGNSASVKEIKIVKSIANLHPIHNGNRCELAPVFLDKGHSIILEFLVKDADVKNTKVDLVVAGHDSIDVKARAMRLLKIGAVLLVIWILTFIAHWRFPQFPVMYYISVGLVFLIALLGTFSIIYLTQLLLW